MNDLIERAARRMLLERAKRNLAARGVHGTDDEALGEPPESSMAVAREDVITVLLFLAEGCLEGLSPSDPAREREAYPLAKLISESYLLAKKMQ